MGGGNLSALSCAGSTSNYGALQLKYLAKNLFDCENMVNESCNPANFPTPDEALISDCNAAVETFKNETKKCMDLSKSTTAIEACSCWTNSEYSETSEVVKNCKIDVVQQIAKAHSNCTGIFSVCRKYEDAVVDIFAFCTSGKLHFCMGYYSNTLFFRSYSKSSIGKST